MQDWNDRYLHEDTPWDNGRPCAELQRVLDEHIIPAGPALEPGCGTGTNCVYLASRGFEPTGIDLSEAAIQRARRKAGVARASCRFIAGDVFTVKLDAQFGFILDRGCYHVVRSMDEAAYVQRLRNWLCPGGRALVLAGNAREKQDPGPPVVWGRELLAAFEPHFRVIHLREMYFETRPRMEAAPLAWSLLLRG